MSQYLAWGQYFFLVFRGKTKKNKKPKWQNLCPSIWHGVSTFGFFGFFGFSKQNQKKQKKQNGRTYVPVSGMGPVLLFFLVFLFFRGFCNILVSDMGSAILFCLCFFRGFCNFLVSDMGSAILLFWFFKVFAIFGLS